MPGESAAAILLAAGESRRLGQPKQLIHYRGITLLERAVQAALGAGASPVVVVLGAHFEQMAALTTQWPVIVAHNRDWPSGMASSLRCGLQATEDHAPNAACALLMVCDQPLLDAEHLKLLLDRHSTTGKVVAAQYGEAIGVPAVFPRAYFERLRSVEGDRGARQILAELPPEELERVLLPECGLDVDTPADVSRMARI